jgi:hypothetical protein
MRAFEHGIYFGLFSTAALISASPKPYVFQSKEEFKSAYTANVENRQPLNLTVGNYSNDFITIGLSLAAAYSLVRLVMSLDNKPIIQQPIHQRPVNQPQQMQSQPVVINNSNRVEVRSPQDRQSRDREYTPDLVDNSSKDPYAWMETLHEVNCLLIYGEQGAGKTTFVGHEVEARKALGHQILVFDPHREYGAWEGLEVIGDGKDYQAIDDELSNINSLITSRYEQRSKVKGFNPKPITIICEEFTQWSVKCANSDNFFQEALSDCRKVRIHVIFVAHARTMGVLTKKAGMSAMFENGSTKLEILGKPNALGKTIPSGFADLYNTKDAKPVRVAIPDLSKKDSTEIDDLFEDEIPNDKVIPINKKRTA